MLASRRIAVDAFPRRHYTHRPIGFQAAKWPDFSFDFANGGAPGMSILVTGGAGFIGSHFTQHLLETTDEQVVCLDNFNAYYDPAIKRANVAPLFGNPRVALVRGDFCEDGEMIDAVESHGVTRIMHLGGYPGVRYSVDHPHIYQEVNAQGTLNVLETARKTGIERVVVVSSSTVYGRGAVAPFQEDAHLGVPLSPYGASKRAAEVLALTYHELHKTPATCVRLFSVYGPRLRPDLAMSIFADRIAKGLPVTIFGDGSVQRDFTHVSDICRGLSAALFTSGVEGDVFNLGHDHPIAMREVIHQLESGCGRRAIVQWKPARREDMPLTHADLSKSKRVLSYQPRVSFEQGCADFCEWHRQAQGIFTHRAAA
jgi:UDP-glucuronate 4-epimerase